MSKYTVRFKVQYTVEVDTDDADNYPDSVVQDCLNDRQVASAMVLFDAQESDAPTDTWASWESAEVVGAYKHAEEAADV